MPRSHSSGRRREKYWCAWGANLRAQDRAGCRHRGVEWTRGDEMPGLMQDKRGLIMGVANDHSIAWGIARTLAANGATLAFTYQGDALGKRVRPLAQSIGAKLVLPCDVEDLASVDAVFDQLRTAWGALDFLVHAIGFSDRTELK